MHFNATIRSNSSLRSLFSKMCVFGKGGQKRLSLSVVEFLHEGFTPDFVENYVGRILSTCS